VREDGANEDVVTVTGDIVQIEGHLKTGLKVREQRRLVSIIAMVLGAGMIGCRLENCGEV
jgi:hypothetical protein